MNDDSSEKAETNLNESKEGESERQARSQNRFGTLKLPKKTADRASVEDMARRINTRYGHEPQKRNR